MQVLEPRDDEDFQNLVWFQIYYIIQNISNRRQPVSCS